jgi:hypothetical protein
MPVAGWGWHSLCVPQVHRCGCENGRQPSGRPGTAVPGEGTLAAAQRDVCCSFTICAEKSTSQDSVAGTKHAMSSARAKDTSAVHGLAFALAAAVLAWPAAANAGDLVVKYDQSQLLRLPRPASEVIIGNPTIADISVQAGNLLVVTGKTFGITNMIVLDAERNVIWDERVLVKRDEAKVVNLQRGTQRQSYNCTPQCNPQIVIGDEEKYFESVAKASQSKVGFSEKAAESSSQTGNR